MLPRTSQPCVYVRFRQSHDLCRSKDFFGCLQIGRSRYILVRNPGLPSKISFLEFTTIEDKRFFEIVMVPDTGIRATQVFKLFPHALEITPEGNKYLTNRQNHF
jgi:hypothetical protein